MPSPSDILREEHRVILRAIALLEEAAGALARGQSPPEQWWEDLTGWLRAFADGVHHAKEERYLFPALARAGVPVVGGPIGVMLDEHAEGRALIGDMSGSDPARRVAAARRYCRLLRDHIDKENGVLLPMSDAVLESGQQATLARQFEDVEAEQGRSASIAAAEADVDRLAAGLAATS
jgi:hemerythrin-like domain-containing protein